MKTKPTLYSDTNILSMLHYQGGHVIALAQHRKTKEWWELERHHFALVTSQRTERELKKGVFAAQRLALASVRRMKYLANNSEIERCAIKLLEAGIVPAAQLGDAIQLAFTTVYRVDYLLTWNYTHLANPSVQRNLDALNRRFGWRSPLMVSPETIPWVSLGQEIRRRNDED